MNPIDLLNKAGIGGYLLLCLSLFSTYLFIKNFILLLLQEKEAFFLKKKDYVPDEKKQCRINHVINDIKQLCNLSSHELKSEILYIFHLNFKDVEHSVSWLRLGASLATLLGLFGTVLGMVQLFKGLSLAKQVDPSVLAGGIWEALLATSMGLFVAITNLIFQHILSNKLKGLGMFAIEKGCKLNSQFVSAKQANHRQDAENFSKNYIQLAKNNEVLS
jgi:hypothetical protein